VLLCNCQPPALTDAFAALEDGRPIRGRTCRSCRAAREGLGFAGHIFSKSLGWGDTFASCRQRRRDYGAKHGASLDDDASTVTWAYAGRGHTDERAAQLVAALSGMRPRPPTRSVAELMASRRALKPASPSRSI
jgi:hypothetical protein